jgi:hypothetical protein
LVNFLDVRVCAAAARHAKDVLQLVAAEFAQGRTDLGGSLLEQTIRAGTFEKALPAEAFQAIHFLLDGGSRQDEALYSLVEKLSDEDAARLPLDRMRALGIQRATALVTQKAFEAAFREHLHDRLHISGVLKWLSEREQLDQLSRSEVSGLVSQVLSFAPRRGAAATWDTLGALTPNILRTQAGAAPALLRSAFEATRTKLDVNAADAWAHIVASIEQHARGASLEACAVSLRLAMQEPMRPVGAVIVASFARFYDSLPSGRRSSKLLDPFGLFDEADGKKLARHELVERFLSSKWDAADLALAAKRAGILQKVVGRLVRLGRRDYVEAMRLRLVKRGQERLAQEVASSLGRVAS